MNAPVKPILNRLRGRHLALLVALDDERTVHRAAGRIAVSQPAATKLLHEIEAMFGVELYERLPRGLEPTEYGRLVTQYARLLVTDLRHLSEEVEAVRGGGTGSVDAGAIMAAVTDHFVGATTRLRAMHPQFKVKLLMETSDILVPLLAQGRLDVVLARMPDTEAAAELDFEPLDDERLCVICGNRNPLARSRKLGLSALAGHPWVLQALPSPMRVLIDREFADAGGEPPMVVVQSSSILATFALVNATDMLAVTPESVATYYKGRGLISVLPVTLRGSLDPYGIITRRGRWLSSAVRLFIDAVRQSRRPVQ